MNNDLKGVIFLIALAALVGAAWYAITRRRARSAVTDEIMSRRYDSRAMNRAVVDAGGDNEAARRLYIRRRLSAMRRSESRSLGKLLGGWAVVIYLIGMVIYAITRLVTGDL